MKLIIGALAMVLLAAGGSNAQTTTITGETREVVATVEAIESSSRTVTLKLQDGATMNQAVPASFNRFGDLRVGDTFHAVYYENLVFRLKQPGEPDVDTVSRSTTPSNAPGPSGTRAKQRTITATITALDTSVPSVTFSGPNGWKYSTKIRDTDMLARVTVGDKMDLTWTDALIVSFDAPVKK